MALRFADLPVRTKFLITLGIPVLGMVLLIGKQVDSSIKRRNVLQYIREQSVHIQLLAGAMHEVQKEGGLAIAFLTSVEPSSARLKVQYDMTDAAIRALRQPEVEKDGTVLTLNAFTSLEVLRQRIRERRVDAREVDMAYRIMKTSLLDDLGRVARLALDPESKDKLYSLLSLLYAKDALGSMRSALTRALSEPGFGPDEMGDLLALTSQYGTSLALFERDAPTEVIEFHRTTNTGPEIDLLNTVLGTLREHRSLGTVGLSAAQWWQLSTNAVERLKFVQDVGIKGIQEGTRRNLRDAEVRLLIVLVALVGVLGAVAFLAFVIMRGIRDTVNEVSSAAQALARGDVRAHVPVRSNDEVGHMAGAFNGMIDNIRSLAASAESIGRGNYDTPVIVRGEQDVLGLALNRMRENLRQARERDMDHNRVLQEEKEKLEQANERIHVLIKEIHHRVKNNLQVVASLLRLQSATIDDAHLQQVFDQSQSRVASMALIHEKLYKGDELAKLDLALYLKELFAELVQLNKVHDGIQYRTSIDTGLALDLNTMVPLGLILNELITNSFKHAFMGREQGTILLSIHQAGEKTYDLIYKDDGVGMPRTESGEGPGTLGISLIESLVDQLNGYITVDSGPGGTHYHIRFRADER
ncbi:MAG: nitrate- and nitrite sensing domain-containing protein [Flavobacteriales bacterium]|nr:nitrate- and nitrite sensing domain-containing protein [Flavobacteriales bacterium]